ncbi:MAG: hypothetical protein SH809_17850 [Rhodothermales bacterium]|nr:hypothetical protein [Rhodothermales bacterium]
MRHTRFDAQTAFVDTPEGIFTADGLWFRVTEVELQAYAGPLLAHVSLTELMARAGRWMLAGQTIGIWAAAGFLLTLPALPATLLTLLVFLLVQCFRPILLSIWFDPVLRILQAVPAQMLVYIVALSAFGIAGAYVKLVLGIAFFVALRWRMLEKMAKPIVQAITRSLYPLPVADQVLRSTILRAALKHRVSLPELDRIEKRIEHLLGRR